MKKLKNPNEGQLFDVILESFPEKIQERLKCGFYGLMRNTILSLLPIEKLAAHFSDCHGRPTKELYSICALMLMKDYFMWTVNTAIHNYMFDFAVRYALNLSERSTELSRATYFRYEKFFVEDELGQAIFRNVTDAIIKSMNIDVSKQRLDSTHVDGNMAKLAQRSLVARVILNFVTQLKRRHKDLHDSLDTDLVNRYEKTMGWLFAPTSEMKNSQASKSLAANQLGQDASYLLQRFADNVEVTNMISYKHLLRVFGEQFEPTESSKDKQYCLKKHPGGKVMVNPSDPDAEIGHKGPGYQVQVSETLKDGNKPSIVTTVIPQGASIPDSQSLKEVLEDEKKNNVLPDVLLCDSGYGSVSNVKLAASDGVELLAPCASNAKDVNRNTKNLEQCKFENFHLISCPVGNSPVEVRCYERKDGTSLFFATFLETTCDNCPLRTECRARKDRHIYRFLYNDNELIIKKAHEYQRTDEFRNRYRPRSGIEGTFGRQKQFTSLGRLHVRGKSNVYSQIFTIFAMYNIMKWVKSIILCLFFRKVSQNRIFWGFSMHDIFTFLKIDNIPA